MCLKATRERKACSMRAHMFMHAFPNTLSVPGSNEAPSSFNTMFERSIRFQVLIIAKGGERTPEDFIAESC